VAGPIRNFKIEISHVERFPIISPVKKQIKTPDGLADVVTYTLEELTATKLRALLERRLSSTRFATLQVKKKIAKIFPTVFLKPFVVCVL
jgi:hypothetical protein